MPKPGEHKTVQSCITRYILLHQFMTGQILGTEITFEELETDMCQAF